LTAMRKLMYRTAITEALREEMERDERVFVIGEDVDICGGVYKMTRGLVEKFGGRRVRGTPISEAAFFGLAVGAAMTGLRPVLEIMYMDFAMVGMDQLINQAAKIHYMSGGQVKTPLVVRGQFGVGTAEASQHSQHLESWFVHTPGFKVVMPATAGDAKGLLKSAIRDDNPVLFLENRVLYLRKDELPEGEWLVPLGLADVKREGSDITVVATSNAVHKSLAAAEKLAGEISAEVIDPRTLDPLDLATILRSVKKTGHLMVVQEGVVGASFGAEVVRQVAGEGFSDLRQAPLVLGAADVPVPFSPVLERAFVPQVDDIIAASRQLLGCGRRS